MKLKLTGLELKHKAIILKVLVRIVGNHQLKTEAVDMHKLAMNTPDIVEQARLLKFSKELNAASIDVTTEEAIEYLTKCPSTLLFVDYYDGKKLAIGIRIKLYFGLDEIDLGDIEAKLTEEEKIALHKELRDKFKNAPERIVEDAPATEDTHDAADAALTGLLAQVAPTTEDIS